MKSHNHIATLSIRILVFFFVLMLATLSTKGERTALSIGATAMRGVPRTAIAVGFWMVLAV